MSRSKDATALHALHMPHSPVGSDRESKRAKECALKYSQHMRAYSATTYATPFDTDDMVSAWCVCARYRVRECVRQRTSVGGVLPDNAAPTPNGGCGSVR